MVDSSSARFSEALLEAVAETGATIAFDAVGGGTLASDILQAMEQAASRHATAYSRYGSSSAKQVYIYGSLDRGPTVLDRSFGLTWHVGGFLLTPFLASIGPARIAELKARVARELTTTFASATLSLSEALSPANIDRYTRAKTGEKYMIDPSRI